MRPATTGSSRSRVTLAAAQLTITRPSSSQYQPGLVSSGAAAPLLTNPGWYWELLGLVIVSCAAASVTRLRLLPVVAGLITYLAGLLLYLNLLFAGPESAGWIVPTKNSLLHLSLIHISEPTRLGM